MPANAITDPKAALQHWSRNPMHGMAALLGPSGLVSVDIDDEKKTEMMLQQVGIDLHALRAEAPCIVGRHFRLLYRAPDIVLRHRSVTWPKKAEPRSSSVLFEFRAGNISDTLPPSIHPGTGRPYCWENPPRNGFPPLPARLLELWQNWSEFNRQALALCPWAPAPKPTPQPKARKELRGESVIGAFNFAHDVGAILEAHGYRRRGKRFASPDTQHAAGIVIMESGKVYCHQQGDPLSSDHALDAFDLYRILQYGGDYRAAVRAAANSLGLNRAAA
jgi:putative DNA primase/helicase